MAGVLRVVSDGGCSVKIQRVCFGADELGLLVSIARVSENDSLNM